MYIRTRDEALENLADILEIPGRRDQIIQSTIRIMLCLEAEPRLFLADCQALLIEGGLETLRARRREAVEAAEDRLLEEVASALDALRFTEAVRQVFPELRADRWQIARALLLYESGVREQMSAAVLGRGDESRVSAARGAVEGMITALRPGWSDRLGAIRSACLETLKRSGSVEPDRLHEEAETLFELFATSDRRAPELLAAIDAGGAEATAQIEKLCELAAAARALLGNSPPPPPGQIRDVA